jgi:membrane protein YqaA with SNARE-associated domain
MAARYKKQLTAFVLFLLFIASWSILLYQFPPQEIVARLGVTNGYAVAFIAGFLGGVSTFTSVPYAIIVLTLGAGGLAPIILGFMSALGLFLGDITSYFLGYYGHQVVPNKLQERLQKVHQWLTNRERTWIIPIFIFLYGALLPLSNDIVVISFGLARYPMWRVMIPLGLGSIVFNTILAYGGRYGFEYFL